jgi:hypothetical protein
MSLSSEEQLWSALQLLSHALNRCLSDDAPARGDFPWKATSLYVAMQQVMLLALEGSKLSARAYQQQARQIVQSLRAVLTAEECQCLATLLHGGGAAG